MPTARDVSRDRGIVMNKESAYEFGLQDNVGALQGAFNPGCWRWWGGDIIPLDTWTQVGVGVDGTNEMHYVNGAFTEQDGCAGSCPANDNHFRIGARTDLWDGQGNDGHASQFLGSIDEVMLFGRMLTAAEIIDVYDATSAELVSAAIDMSSLPDGLIGYWPLDGDGTDVSGNGLDGEEINAEWVTGAYGLAFHFSGDDAILVAESGDTVLDASNVLMLTWVMPTNRDVAADRGIVMNKESSYEFGLMDNTGQLQGAFGPGCWRWWGNDVVPLNEWTHVGVGVDGTNERHFVNGAFTEEDGCGGSLTINDEDFKIGARGGNGGHGSQFKGAIDEGMLFDSCLDEAGVAAVYGAFVGQGGAAKASDLPDGLIGYWPMDGDGSDKSGNGLDAEPLNAEWVPGLTGLAFFFNGDDALKVEDNDIFDIANPLMMVRCAPRHQAV